MTIKKGHACRPAGFTLIETLLYLALYAFLMAGIMSAVYGLFESSDRDATSALVEEEGDFLIGKIGWMLSDARSVEAPAHSGDQLTLVRADGSTISLWSSGTAIEIQENSASTATLNDSDILITDLSFIHMINDGSESIMASFTVHATTSDGLPLSRTFSTLSYIRQ